MKSVKGTRTEKNLLTAFAGESQARNRYDYFAGQAKKDGYVEMARAFEEIANQEKEHAKRLFKFLEGGEVEISGAFPAGVIGATYDNLLAAAAGENHEHQHMYPEFAQVAEGEDITEIAKSDEAFHDIIYYSTDNDKLILLLNQLREQMYRYRIEHIKIKERRSMLIREHQEIIDALRERDSQTAVLVMRRHINNQEIQVGRKIKEKE